MLCTVLPSLGLTIGSILKIKFYIKIYFAISFTKKRIHVSKYIFALLTNRSQNLRHTTWDNRKLQDRTKQEMHKIRFHHSNKKLNHPFSCMVESINVSI